REVPLHALLHHGGDEPAHAHDGGLGLEAAAGERARRASGGDGWTGREAQDHHGVPDPHHTRAAWRTRPRGVGYERVDSLIECAGGCGHPHKEPRIGRSPGSSSSS
ncbi:unnamed protein product, partial [Ectocarpus sp. 13 AM-2016]